MSSSALRKADDDDVYTFATIPDNPTKQKEMFF